MSESSKKTDKKTSEVALHNDKATDAKTVDSQELEASDLEDVAGGGKGKGGSGGGFTVGLTINF